MPKKRSRDTSQDVIDRYNLKIKKIQEEQKRKRRRIVIESSSEPDERSPERQVPTSYVPTPDDNVDVTIASTSGTADGAAILPAVEAFSLRATEADSKNQECPELDNEVLAALGDATGEIPIFGDKIHQSLAQRWEPILRKGLEEDLRDKLLKQYLVPENCTLLQAPKLNNEVAAAVTEATRVRDKRRAAEQQQLGAGISAINNALTLMLTGDNKIEAIRVMGDGCRILTDLHHQGTQARMNVIGYTFSKPFLNIVKDSERDDTLYGNKLAEKIKASKTIEKQGLSIKKVPKAQPLKSVSTTEQTVPSTRPQYQYGSYQENWSRPPRFQQNRGGRGGPRRTNTPTNRRFPPQPVSYAAGPSKPRPPAVRQ